MNKLNVKKDDTVVIIAGKDKGKQGKILASFPKKERVIVQNANMIVCHTKPRKQGEQGGIVKRETPIRACKVALYCGKCGKGVRVGFKIEGDKKTRVCAKCGAEI